MAHKMSWLILSVSVAGAAAGATYLLTSRSARATASTENQHELVERLERLEAGMPAVKRGLTQAGVQMSALALSAAAAAGKGQPAGEQRPQRPALSVAERAVKEREHYDHLDQLVRAGGGAALTAQLQKNIESARAKRPEAGGGELDIAKLDCSDALCRVEVRPKGPDVASGAFAGLRIMGPGMGPMSMRPQGPGDPAVFYVAAPGKRLPRFEF